jgi:apolipoprotein N-acyltransferase
MKWLRSVTRDQYVPGAIQSPVYDVGGYKLAANICVEDIHPDLAREAANNGASLLLNITNDGWFYGNFGPRSHLQAALLRSVEVRRPVLRVTNTGYTVLVDPLGRYEVLVPHETAGTGVARPLLLPAKGIDTTLLPKTIYARFGELGVTLFAAGCLLIAWLSRWRNEGEKAVQ